MRISFEDFCSKDKTRPSINTPFSIGEYSYATDGFIIVRIKNNGKYNANKNAPDFTELVWNHESIKKWQAIPKITMKKCEECKGEGRINDCQECYGRGIVSLENDFSDYECECNSCDGDGKSEYKQCCGCNGKGEIPIFNYVKIGNGSFNPSLLEKIIQLDGAMINTDAGELDPLPFIFNGGCGFIMPVRVKEG